MTIWELVRVLLRRWPVVVVGLLATGAVAMGPAKGQSVVFSRTELAFLAPTNAHYPNALRTTSDAVIMTAGVIAKRISGPEPMTKFGSTEVTLIGQGIRDGWSLRLPDTGGQWAPNFATQVLVLEVVAPTKQEVERRQAALISRVQQELSSMQDGFGVAGQNKISVIEAPERSVSYSVTGDRHRASAMAALLGVGATTTAALLLDRGLGRRGGEHTPRSRRGRTANRRPRTVSD